MKTTGLQGEYLDTRGMSGMLMMVIKATRLTESSASSGKHCLGHACFSCAGRKQSHSLTECTQHHSRRDRPQRSGHMSSHSREALSMIKVCGNEMFHTGLDALLHCLPNSSNAESPPGTHQHLHLPLPSLPHLN